GLGPGLGQLLRAVLSRLSLARRDTVEAAALVNELAARLVQAVKRDSSFREVEKLGTGSYYEHLKISEPNEFDIMLKVPIPRVQLDECDATGAFHYVSFKRHPQRHLDKFLEDDGKLSANAMLLLVRNIIKKEVKNITNMTVTVKKKKPGSPAVTLLIEKPQAQISVDIILALEYRSQSWPRSTEHGLNIDQWLGKKVKQAFKQNPLYLVPKHAKNERVIKASTWRLSFSHIEKDIIKNHGNTKTCCEYGEVKCCRKECLKLLKHLLEQLKAKYKSRRELDKFCSYHAKTAFFHMCARWPEDKDWQSKDLDHCFYEFVDYFLDCLQKSDLPHFFIPKHNLFSPDLVDTASTNFLSRAIKYELNNNFPIFELEN
ncbi:PREDICTED: cyclic GMP-AMP synthase, partial [Gavialis gangeticus]|uniref:cyclic GMP-AMP synthase n=1 Tax=Gavialis gangeticus TaxID=94835 RepID=UPI00092EB403